MTAPGGRVRRVAAACAVRRTSGESSSAAPAAAPRVPANLRREIAMDIRPSSADGLAHHLPVSDRRLECAQFGVTLLSLFPGARLGPYEILAPLGAGGMGEVYRARDPRLGREVALKVLPEEVSLDKDRLSRFEQEARSASALNHPNIITIYEIGQAEQVAFIAMELVEGKTLRELCAVDQLPVRRAIGIAVQIAAGLAKGHAVGIVHRDLTPENVMVSPEPPASERWSRTPASSRARSRVEA